MEYLLNFMERLEEGLSEDSSKIGSHMRVSDFQKRDSEVSESFLTDNSSIGQSTMVDSQRNSSAASENPSMPGYSHIDDSYF